MTLRELYERTRIDVTPLRVSRDFRLLFVGGAVSYIGSMITYVALPFQLKELTGSYLQVGLLGAVEVVPLVVFGLWGGALADALDRRRVVVWTEVAFTVLSAALVVNAMLDSPRIWPLYAFGFVVAALDGLQRPSLDAMIPRIVPLDLQGSAAALSSIRMNIGTLLGPAIGGILVATAGPATAYSVDVVSFRLLARLPARHGRSSPYGGRNRTVTASDRRRLVVRLVAQGLARHLRHRSVRDVLRLPVRSLPVHR